MTSSLNNIVKTGRFFFFFNSLQLKEDIAIKSSPIFHEYGREREGLGIHWGHSLNKFEFDGKKFPLKEKIFRAAESVI